MAQEKTGAAAAKTAAPSNESKTDATGAEAGVTPPADPNPTPPATTASGVNEDGVKVGPDADAVAGLAGDDTEVKSFPPQTPAALPLAPAPADSVDTSKLERKTIKHGLFYYSDPSNPRIERLAHRGETVELLPADVERGELLDAFTLEVGQEPSRFGRLPEFPTDSGLDMQKRWLASASAEEVVTYVNSLEETDRALVTPVVVEAERARGREARNNVLAALGA